MKKILLNGCGGAMGKVISEMADENPEIEIAAGIDVRKSGKETYPVFSDISECRDISADVIVDFSAPQAVPSVLEFASERKIPAVICTTGLNEGQLSLIKKTSETVAVLRSSNMSLGINLIEKLASEAAKVLSDAGFDIEIVEKHHHRKLDAPSGTALEIADCMNSACDNRFHYVYDRSGKHEKRDPLEIGISAVRAGSIVGDHDILFAGDDEVITISHMAYSRKIFARGALSAAVFLAGKSAGYYTMADVISAGKETGK